MSQRKPVVTYEELPFLERYGIEWLWRRAENGSPIRIDDKVHEFTDEELAGVKRAEHRAIARAALAGALSALASVVAVFIAEGEYDLEHGADAWTQVKYYSIVYGATVVATIIEVVYLYWEALYAVSQLARAAGLDLAQDRHDTRNQELVGALARAALELPNPVVEYFGIHPHREASRWRLALYAIAYKGKVAITNFVAKALVRRMLGRGTLKGLAELVSIPVVAVWNGFVTWLVVREARVRVVGPGLAQALTRELWSLGSPTPQQEEAAARAVASSIVRTRDLHPNLVRLLWEIDIRGLDHADIHDLDHTDRFLATFDALPDNQRAWVVAVSTAAAVIDGRLAPAERDMLKRLRQSAGLSTSLDGVAALAKKVRVGQRITGEMLLSA